MRQNILELGKQMKAFKITIGMLTLCISMFGIALYGAGNHGHFMFRPHMKEDWIIWGTVFISGIIGITILFRQAKK